MSRTNGSIVFFGVATLLLTLVSTGCSLQSKKRAPSQAAPAAPAESTGAHNTKPAVKPSSEATGKTQAAPKLPNQSKPDAPKQTSSQPPKPNSAKPVKHSKHQAKKPSKTPISKTVSRPVTPNKKTPPAKKTKPATSHKTTTLAVTRDSAATSKPEKMPTTVSNQQPAPLNPGTVTEQPIMVELESLPLTIKGHWILDLDDPADTKQCILKSQSVQIDDGQGGTPLLILYTMKQLTIKTKSNIDPSYPGTGLEINGEKFALETISNETNVLFRTQFDQITQALNKGSIAKVTLGFWPTWPHTQSYSQEVPVSGFTQAYHALQRCNQLVSSAR